MAQFCLRFLLPALLGLMWVYVAMATYLGISEVSDASAGTHTIESIFYNPMMSVWYLADLPTCWRGLRLGLLAFYAYHASLAVLFWNADHGRRLVLVASAAYTTHLGITLFLTLVCGSGVPIPRLSGFYLAGDLMALLNLVSREPVPVAQFAFCLAAWHAFAIGCLAQPWLRQRSAT